MYILFDLEIDYSSQENFHYYEPDLFDKNVGEKIHEKLDDEIFMKRIMTNIKEKEQSLKYDILNHCEIKIHELETK